MTGDNLPELSELSVDELAALEELLQRTDAHDPILAKSGADVAPLSWSQWAVWVQTQLHERDAAYNLSGCFRLSGPLDTLALAEALTEVVRRHGSLRTTFHLAQGAPRQRIEPSGPVSIELDDLRNLPFDVREARAREIATAAIELPFDLENGPVFRATLLQVAADVHMLVLVVHHLVTDGWSMGLLYAELGRLYSARREGTSAVLPDIGVQYGDFAAWQNDRSEVRDALIAFWRNHLEGFSPAALPFDRPQSAQASMRGASVFAPLDAALTARVDALALATGTTRFMVLFSAFAVLAARYTRQDDVVIGVPFAGRDLQQLENLVGFFVNVAPVRVRVSRETRVRDLLEQVRSVSLSAYEHQHVPFQGLLDALGLKTSPDRHPLFQMTFSAQDRLLQPLQLAGLDVEVFDVANTASRFDLEASVLESDGGARVGFTYKEDLFEAATVVRIAKHYVWVVEQLVASPERRVSEVELLTAGERSAEVARAQGARAAYPAASLGALVAAQAATRPEAVALECGATRLTYRTLDGRANQVAQALRRAGVRLDARVGVLLPRGIEQVVALLGVVKAGGAYVALDPADPAGRVTQQLTDAAAHVVITRPGAVDARVVAGRTVVSMEAIEGESTADPAIAVPLEALAYVAFTSGSTGQPKGVAVPHRGVVRLLYGQSYVRLGPDETLLQLAPVSFDASTLEIWGALVHGGRLVIYPERVPEPAALGAVLADTGVTTAWLTASLYNTIVTQAPAALQPLRQLLIGGEALSVPHVRAGLAALPATTLVNGYGPTESTTFTCCYPIPRPWPAEQAIPLGGPIANTAVYVLDRAGEVVPPGVPGELYVGGAGLARGYTGAARLTAEKFVPDGVSGAVGARLYRTGDTVRWPADGPLAFLGRRDGQVKLRGYRIELGEVEAALRAVAGVALAAATVQGTGEHRRLVGYVVPSGGPPLAPATVRAALQAQLPGYLVPAAIVVLDALPLTATGKVDRDALPAPEIHSTAATSAPRSAIEAEMASLWAAVLRLPTVGIHDNFFDLGGDSILAIQIASAAAARGLRVAPRHFFERQTIAELAPAIEESSQQRAEQGPVSGVVPLTPIQRWFFEENLAQPNHFNQSALLALRQRLDAATIQEALDALLAHHDVLRSRFRRAGADWVQEIVPPGEPAALHVVDLTNLEPPAQAKRISGECATLQDGLDITAGPLLRAAWFRLGSERDDRLFLTIHHLVVDGVSWRILLEDLHSAFAARRDGLERRLPAKTTSFREWAEHLSSLNEGWLLSQCEFWRAEDEEPPEWPVDGEMSTERTTYGASATLTTSFTAEETSALLTEPARAFDSRVHETLLTGVVLALAKWSGAPVVEVDVEGHGREPVNSTIDVSRTVGWFTATYPVRFRVDPGAGVADVLVSVRDTLRAVPAGGIGYGVLRFAGGDPDTRLQPARRRPAVSFNYLGQFDAVLSDTGLFGSAPEPSGTPVGGANLRPYLLEVNARVLHGTLQVDWTYSPDVHARTTVERLAESLKAHVYRVLDEAHLRSGCQLQAHSLAALDDGRLQQVLARYPSGVDDLYPLTPLQQGMVIHSLAGEGSGAFVTQINLLLRGDIESDLFRDVWERAQRAHAILRTVFADAGDGEFRQVVLAAPPLSWTVEDWSSLEDTDRAARLQRFLDADRCTGFSVATLPPSRFTLIRTGGRAWRFIWTHHHALLDGWSAAMLLEEVFRLYNAAANGNDVSIERRPEFRDHIAWLMSRDRSGAADFWRRMLGGITSPTRLSCDRAPGSRVQTVTQIQEVERQLSPEATRRLIESAARQRVTLSTVAHGAWALLLSRYSGSDDVMFGTAVAGRPAVPGVDRTIGLFLNGVPLRTTVDPAQRIDTWLSGLQQRLVAVREREHDASWEIQGWSDLPSGEPLFDTTLAFENYPVAPAYNDEAQRIGLADFTLVAHTSAALHLRVVPGDRLRLMLNYDTGRFDPQTAGTMLAQVEAVLQQFAAAPEARLEGVSLLAEGESGSWPPLDGAWRGAVHQQISDCAVRNADRIAISDGALKIPYRELEERSDRIARTLLRAGADMEDVVAVCAPRGSSLVVAILGVLKAGAAFLVLDPEHPPPLLLKRLEIAGARIVLVDDLLMPRIPVLDEWAGRQGGRVIPLAEAYESEPLVAHERPVVSADSLAYVAFTSGSEGTPKAVLGRHAALSRYAGWLNEAFGFGGGDRCSMLSALSHDPLLRDVFPPLQVGATLCVPGDQVSGAAGALASWARAEGVTFMNLTPPMAHVLVEGAAEGAVPTLRCVCFVGEPLHAALVNRLRRIAPGVHCVNLYGATETQQALSHFVVPTDLDETGASLPVGRGIPGVHLLVARRGGYLAGVGEVGDVWMRSPLLARGYLGETDGASSPFVEDAFGPGSGRAYRTGDLGRLLPGGDVVVLGRTDDQLKIRGFRVEPSEIEGALLHCAGVDEVAVVAMPAGAGEHLLVAYIVGGANGEDVRAFAALHLPRHTVPQRVVTIDRLPRTRSGKIDRRELARRPLPSMEARGEHRLTPTEQILADIWKELLPVDRVHRSDRFFDLGGHSVLAARLVARVRSRLAIELRIADVFACPALSELAALVERASRDAEAASLGELLEEIQALSPEELQTILDDAARLGGAVS